MERLSLSGYNVATLFFCIYSIAAGEKGIYLFRAGSGDDTVSGALSSLKETLNAENSIQGLCVNHFCCDKDGVSHDYAVGDLIDEPKGSGSNKDFGNADNDNCVTKILSDARDIRLFCVDTFSSSLEKCSDQEFNRSRICCDESCNDDTIMVKSCSELFKAGVKTSGIYTVYPDPSFGLKKIQVYCDMDTNGGGWTVFQRRGDYGGEHVNFYRKWSDYAKGFGDLNKEFWLGNEYLHILTAQEDVILHIDLIENATHAYTAEYKSFRVSSSEYQYSLAVGKYKGNAGDSLSYSNETSFKTYDHEDSSNCAEKYRSGWWFKACALSNLNGVYLTPPGYHPKVYNGIHWAQLGQEISLAKTEMKFRLK